jgi:hypothetical protein
VVVQLQWESAESGEPWNPCPMAAAAGLRATPACNGGAMNPSRRQQRGSPNCNSRYMMTVTACNRHRSPPHTSAHMHANRAPLRRCTGKPAGTNGGVQARPLRKPLNKRTQLALRCRQANHGGRGQLGAHHRDRARHLSGYFAVPMDS